MQKLRSAINISLEVHVLVNNAGATVIIALLSPIDHSYLTLFTLM